MGFLKKDNKLNEINELFDFIDSFVVMHSFDKECKFLPHKKNLMCEAKLPKDLIVEIHCKIEGEATLIFQLHGGTGSYAKWESFVEKVKKQNYLFRKTRWHQYRIDNINFEDVIDIFSNHINWLIE